MMNLTSVKMMFFQINIDKEEVVYMQNDMTLSNDSFLATITNLEVTLKDQLFNIRVIPLIKRTEPFVCETKTPLTQKHLDASQLAGLTNSNPIYFLVDVPKHGKIMRIVRPSGSRSKVIIMRLSGPTLSELVYSILMLEKIAQKA
jgi:chondroitin sulfate proteoglycan 4